MLRARLFAVAALALTLSACDAVDTASLSDDDLADAATAVANAVALDAGGVLEDAAAGAALAASADGNARHGDRPGCRAERTYDEAAGLWTAVADCERGDPDGAFYASFERTSTYRFLDAAGQPQPSREGAATIEQAVLSGASLMRSPRGTHALLSLASALTISDLEADLVTVNGTVQRAATDTLRGRRGERTLAYELDATLSDVRGPRATSRHWRTAVDGTISGTLRATLTRTPADGETDTVEIDEAFTITFPLDGAGGRVAEIVLGGRRFRADVETGAVEG